MVVVGVLPLSIRVAVIVLPMSVLLCFSYLTQVGMQSFEAFFPVAAVLADPIGDLPQRPRLQSTRSPLRLPSLLDETGLLEHSEGTGDGRLAHVEGCGEVLDRGLALGESGQDRAPRGVGEGGECRAEGVCLLHVHHYVVI